MDYKYISSYKQNDFLFEGAHCFYNNEKAFLLSINGTSILIDNEILKQIENKNLNDDIAFKLFQRGFGKAYENNRFLEENNDKPIFFMIDFTTKCNCNCIYCLRHFEDVGDSISLNMIEKIVNYISKYCVKHGIHKIFFQPWGGEPLIEIDKIIFCKKLFEKNNIDASFSIQTNGLLLDFKNFEKLQNNNIEIGISLDGLASVHDKHRVDVRGNKTHKKIISNLLQIKKKYANFQPGTLSVNSIYSLNYISENIKYIVNDLKINNIKFNLVHPSGSIKFDDNILIKKENLDKYVNSIFDTVVQQIKEGKHCYEANIIDKAMNILNNSSNNICNSKGCRGGKLFVSFDQKGNIYPCEMIGRDEMCIGNVSDNIDLVELIDMAKETNPYYKERITSKCSSCPFYFYCRGGCKACSISYGKEAFEIDDIECEINKRLYPKLIELLCNDPITFEKMICKRVLIKYE